MHLDFKPFDRNDWMSFAGTQGDNPQIAIPSNFTCVILGADSLDVLWEHEGENEGFVLKANELTVAGAQALLVSVDFSHWGRGTDRLVFLGFEAIGPCYC